MTKAEKFAVKIYPHGVFQGEEGDSLRAACMLGYGQAEKDLALTEDDIRTIVKIHYNLVFKDETGILVGDAVKETLRRFNELKAKKK